MSVGIILRPIYLVSWYIWEGSILLVVLYSPFSDFCSPCLWWRSSWSSLSILVLLTWGQYTKYRKRTRVCAGKQNSNEKVFHTDRNAEGLNQRWQTFLKKYIKSHFSRDLRMGNQLILFLWWVGLFFS